MMELTNKNIEEYINRFFTLFHVDAIQAYGKFVIRPKKEHIDLLSVSAHKIHGPKGVGFLYIDERVKIRPLIYGGGQQRDLRSGTENVPGIAGLGMAAEEIYANHRETVEKITAVKDYMIDRMAELDGVSVNSKKGDQSAPQIVSASFQGVRSEVLLHALEDKGIYVSSGSACSSNHPAISGTLKAVGVKKDLLDSTLRFSFGVFNTTEEVDYCIETLKELLPVLRRYSPVYFRAPFYLNSGSPIRSLSLRDGGIPGTSGRHPEAAGRRAGAPLHK